MSSVQHQTTGDVRQWDVHEIHEVTCDACARPFIAVRRRHYCDHCAKFYYICPTCRDNEPKCRYCGTKLKKKGEPIFK